MEFPKKLLVVVDGVGVPFAGVGLADIPRELLEDGVEVGIYLFRRMKKVEITRKLVKVDPLDTEPDEDVDPPTAPEAEVQPGLDLGVQ